jgi:hypothetical protein
MSKKRTGGGTVVTSAERPEGHDTMDEDELPDTGMTAGHLGLSVVR